MSQKPDTIRSAGPPAPVPPPRKIVGRGRRCVLRDDLILLCFLIAGIAVIVAAVLLTLNLGQWRADEQLMATGKHATAGVYAVDTYRGESRRTRDQSGSRYAHFVFPVVGEEWFEGWALMPESEIPAGGVGAKIDILRLCPPHDVEVYAVASQYMTLRDDATKQRTAFAKAKIDLRQVHHARAHPMLKRATVEYSFTLDAARVPRWKPAPPVAGSQAASRPATVTFRGSYALTREEEAAVMRGGQIGEVPVRYLVDNPHVQMPEPVLQRLTAGLGREARIVEGVVTDIRRVTGLRPRLELDDWREVYFKFPTGRVFTADDPAVRQDPSLLGKPERFEYGNVQLSGLEASDPVEGDRVELRYDPADPQRFVVYAADKRASRTGAEPRVVALRGPQVLTSALMLPGIILAVGLVSAGFGVARLRHVRGIARNGRAALATVVSVATSSLGFNSRRNFLRYEFSGRRLQSSHTASVKHTGELAEGDRVWVLVDPAQSRTAMIAGVILPPDQFDGGSAAEAAAGKAGAAPVAAKPALGGRAAAMQRAKKQQEEEGL